MESGTDPAIALLRDLVAIDSVNPTLVPGARGEAEIARRLADELRSLGLVVEITDVAPGRPNVVGVLEGRGSGRSLMFCGHTDTVGVAGMTRPFDPQIRDGKLFGRGSQDMKGGVAAMVGAARAIVESGGLERGRLVIAAVADEEHSSLGADALVRTWRADAAVVTEPTSLDVAVAHKGFQWIVVETRGRAAHGSRPRDGRDAIMRMGRVLSRLERLEQTLRTGTSHDLLGTASLHASLIEGGQELSSYPARASLQFERRTLPGEPADAALTETLAILNELRAEDPEFEGDAKLVFGRDAYEIAPSSHLPGALLQAATAVGCGAKRVGMTFWTDASILGAAGIPTVLFGPGGAGLHSTEEYVWLDDVCRCRDALAGLARGFTSSL
jgi:acetylornithine deacetylase